MFERRHLTLTAGILPPRPSIDAKLQNKIIMSVPIRRRKYEHVYSRFPKRRYRFFLKYIWYIATNTMTKL
jgi:hypothetical protein